MVDASAAAESRYITAELVEASPTKIVIPIDSGKYEEGKFGDRLTIGVELDGKRKTWSPNRASAESLNKKYTTDTNKWLGKEIELIIIDDKVYVK